MPTVSDFTAVTVSTADTPLTFDYSFKGGAWLVGKFDNPGSVHFRRASGCTSSNSPPIPNAPAPGSVSELFPLLPYHTKPGETIYLTPSSGTNIVYVYPVFES